VLSRRLLHACKQTLTGSVKTLHAVAAAQLALLHAATECQLALAVVLVVECSKMTQGCCSLLELTVKLRHGQLQEPLLTTLAL
jgi:hypothetical protein